MGGLSQRPEVFVSASAVGYYGDKGDKEVSEEDARGKGFLADVCEGWEAEARRAESLGMRSVQMRTAPVLLKSGGILMQLTEIHELWLHLCIRFRPAMVSMASHDRPDPNLRGSHHKQKPVRTGQCSLAQPDAFPGSSLSSDLLQKSSYPSISRLPFEAAIAGDSRCSALQPESAAGEAPEGWVSVLLPGVGPGSERDFQQIELNRRMHLKKTGR